MRARTRADERDAEADHHDRQDQVDDVLSFEHDGRAREQPQHLAESRQLAECDDGAREGHGADERADEQLDAVAGRNRVADVERGWVVHDGDGDQHCSQADERVHRGDQLRHLGHLHAVRDDPPDEAAEGKGAKREIDAPGDGQRREDGQRHAGDAEPVTPAGA